MQDYTNKIYTEADELMYYIYRANIEKEFISVNVY